MSMTLGLLSKLTNFRWLNLFERKYTNKNGKEGSWLFASRKSLEQLETIQTRQPDAVVIIPLLKTSNTHKLVVIEEFRIPLADYEWGFPAGLIDKGEGVVPSATRELFEETGLKLKRVYYTSPSCVSSAGLSDEAVQYVVCECEGEVTTKYNEGSEDIKVHVLDLNDLRSLLNSNNAMSAKALPYFQMFDAIQRIHWPKHMVQ